MFLTEESSRGKELGQEINYNKWAQKILLKIWEGRQNLEELCFIFNVKNRSTRSVRDRRCYEMVGGGLQLSLTILAHETLPVEHIPGQITDQ